MKKIIDHLTEMQLSTVADGYIMALEVVLLVFLALNPSILLALIVIGIMIINGFIGAYFRKVALEKRREERKKWKDLVTPRVNEDGNPVV